MTAPAILCPHCDMRIALSDFVTVADDISAVSAMCSRCHRMVVVRRPGAPPPEERVLDLDAGTATPLSAARPRPASRRGAVRAPNGPRGR